MSERRPTSDTPAPWDGAYRNGTPPWEIGRPQPVFVRLADQGAIRSPVLDSGCGTGENALFLASRGLEVVGVDFSPAAIGMAREKAAARGLAATFMLQDALALDDLDRHFATVIDSGLFHVFTGEEQSLRYVANLRAVLELDGVLHLICFSDREPDWGGPQRVTQDELRSAFADGWRIDSIEPALFETTREAPAQAWLARIVRLPD
ncbi:MAG: class I SAM-dependent methyltransferase [Chloroflexota bacterium]|nr:class I SAM-dependent methyltransferase [Chloroflexota bacterium]